ncbi:MAG: hypothetical protein NTZ01_03040 [Verrucomicrobia bacterium]|nr:hypothetical protein [Verrucomicrobiota bacterium]
MADGVTLATQKLEHDKPGESYEETYPPVAARLPAVWTERVKAW